MVVVVLHVEKPPIVEYADMATHARSLAYKTNVVTNAAGLTGSSVNDQCLTKGSWSEIAPRPV